MITLKRPFIEANKKTTPGRRYPHELWEKFVMFPNNHELKNIEDNINEALFKLMEQIKNGNN